MKYFWARRNTRPNSNLSNIAVLLIDMQDRFVKKIRKGRADPTIAAQLEIIRHCTKKNIPIAVLELRRYGKTISALKEELANTPTVRTIKKSYNSGFLDTSLKRQLVEWGTQEVILMGVNAQFCVKETAQGAISYNLHICTSPDLISGQDHHRNDDEIEWYRSNGDVVPVGSVLTKF